MSTKHAVHHARHTKHLVTARTHAAHPVHARKLETGIIRPFESIGSVVEDLLTFPMPGNMVTMPPVDIRETDKNVEVSMPLEGVRKNDINLDLTEDTLTISGERCGEKQEKVPGGYEQSYSSFYRSFILPAAVKTGEAKAVYRNGVLRVTLHKQKPARIQVE